MKTIVLARANEQAGTFAELADQSSDHAGITSEKKDIKIQPSNKESTIEFNASSNHACTPEAAAATSVLHDTPPPSMMSASSCNIEPATDMQALGGHAQRRQCRLTTATIQQQQHR
jgi:hypothetical protein